MQRKCIIFCRINEPSLCFYNHHAISSSNTSVEGDQEIKLDIFEGELDLEILIPWFTTNHPQIPFQ